MSDTTGWRVEQDRHDRDWYVVDGHGDTRAGPFPTPLAGCEWLEEWRVLLAERRAVVEQETEARMRAPIPTDFYEKRADHA